MLNTLYTGLSGLDATGQWLSVIGNNVANSATPGFKSSRAQFADMVASSYMSVGGSAGIGALPPLTQVQFTQGTINATSNPLDMAIQGNGFFLVKDAGGNSFYTRAGQFSLDSGGRVVAPGGYVLQGYLADASGTIGKIVGAITTTATASASTGSQTAGTANQTAGTSNQAASTISSPAKASANVTITGNLQATATAIPGGFDIANPSGTSNFATSLTLYDSEGGGHLTTVYFTKTADNAWTYNVVANGTSAGSGTLSFGTDGQQTGGQAASLSLSFGSTSQSVSFDLSQMTQYSSSSTIGQQSQDGYQAGTFQNLTVDGAGQVIANFSNGQSRALAQVAVNQFVNPQGLAQTGSNLFTATTQSGAAIQGKPNQNGLGQVVGGSLEQSNVDLSSQFVDMIAAEREYQANARVITTIDEVLVQITGLIQ